MDHMNDNHAIIALPLNGHQHIPDLKLVDAEEPLHTTDAGNARRLAIRHGEDLRYCWQTNQWLVWDGRRWRPDATGEVMRRAKQTARSIYQEAFREEE